MLKLVTLSGIHYNVDEMTHKYVLKKLAGLDKYLPRHARKSATIDVKLKQVNRDHGNKYEAEVVLVMPEKTVVAKDSTVNMLAAIDIVEAKMITQLRKIKSSLHPF